MLIESKCKFCGCKLTLDVDDDYASLNDPFKLLSLAACNRCADLRARRLRLHSKFISVVGSIPGKRDDAEAMTKVRRVLEALTKAYLRLVSDWTGVDLAWEEVMVEPFISAPQSLGKHLRVFWGLVKQQQQLEI